MRYKPSTKYIEFTRRYLAVVYFVSDEFSQPKAGPTSFLFEVCHKTILWKVVFLKSIQCQPRCKAPFLPPKPQPDVRASTGQLETHEATRQHQVFPVYSLALHRFHFQGPSDLRLQAASHDVHFKTLACPFKISDCHATKNT